MTDSYLRSAKENQNGAIREFGPEQVALAPGLPGPLRAYLQEGPQSFVDNAQVVMSVLEVDGKMVPIVLADPGRLECRCGLAPRSLHPLHV